MNEPTDGRPNEPVNDQLNDPMNDVDWWASRLVDREIAFADVPADLRGAVLSRVEEFDAQRRTLNRFGVEHRVDPAITDRAVTAALQPPTAVVVPFRRRLVPLVGVAAASLAVIVVGVTILRGDDRPDVVAIDANPAAVEAVADLTNADDERSVSNDAIEVPPSADGNTMAMTIDTEVPETDQSGAADSEPESRQKSMPTDVTEIADMIELADYLEQWLATPPALLDGAAACEDDEGRPAIAVNVRFAGIDAQAYFSPEAGVMLRAVADCLKLATIVP